MTFKPLVMALALCAAGPSMAASCSSTFSLGTIGPGNIVAFGNFFGAAGTFNDCYSFTLSATPASATSTTVEWDWSSRLDVNLSSVSLSGGSVLSHIDTGPLRSWTFGDLTAGDYQLSLAGNVYDTGAGSAGLGVGYSGMLTTSGPAVVTPVPEPATVAMLALGFAAVAWGTRRRA